MLSTAVANWGVWGPRTNNIMVKRIHQGGFILPLAVCMLLELDPGFGLDNRYGV